MNVVEMQPTTVLSRGAGRSTPIATQSAIKDITPFAVALIPFGLALGSASATAGLSLGETMFGAAVLFAGASQLAAVEVLGSGGGVLATAVVVTLINLRFVFYGAGVARWFDGAPLGRRLLLAFPLVDQTFMLCQERFEDQEDLSWRQRYYVTATAVLALTFLGSQYVAFQLGASLPEGLGLHLAAPLAFAGMLAKAMTGKPHLVAGAAAGATVVFGSAVLGAAALPIGVVLGVAAATKTASAS
jgi:predicted branched-subunit amino acid permease